MTADTEFTFVLTGRDLQELLPVIEPAIAAEIERRRRHASALLEANVTALGEIEHARADTLSTAAAKLRHAELVAASKRVAA